MPAIEGASSVNVPESPGSEGHPLWGACQHREKAGVSLSGDTRPT